MAPPPPSSSGMLPAVFGHLRGVGVGVLAYATVLVVGALGFLAIERGVQMDARQQYVAMQLQLQAELSNRTYEELVRGGYWRHVEPSDHLDMRTTGGAFRKAVLLAFTLASTIGFGSVTLYSGVGRAFSVVYSLFAIPLTVAFYMFVAARVARFMQVVLVSLTHPSWSTFRKYDVDGNGTLDKRELHTALRDLGMTHVTQDVAFAIIVHMQAEGQQLSYAQFCEAVRLLLPPKVMDWHHKARFGAAFVACVVWLLLGGAVFARCEGWRFQDALWFSWETLSLIGLGDFVPGTAAGEVATIVWSTLGLGFLAMLLSIVGEKVAQVVTLEDVHHEHDQPSPSERCELRVRRFLRESSNLLLKGGNKRRRRRSNRAGPMASLPNLRPAGGGLLDDAPPPSPRGAELGAMPRQVTSP